MRLNTLNHTNIELFLFFSLFNLFSNYLITYSLGERWINPCTHPTFDLCPQTPRIFKESCIVPEKEIKLYIDFSVLLFWFIPRIYIDRLGNPRSLTIASLVTSVLPAPHCIALQRSYPNIDRTEYDYIFLTATLYMYITLCLQCRRDLLLIFGRLLHDQFHYDLFLSPDKEELGSKTTIF